MLPTFRVRFKTLLPYQLNIVMPHWCWTPSCIININIQNAPLRSSHLISLDFFIFYFVLFPPGIYWLKFYTNSWSYLVEKEKSIDVVLRRVATTNEAVMASKFKSTSIATMMTTTSLEVQTKRRDRSSAVTNHQRVYSLVICDRLIDVTTMLPTFHYHTTLLKG